MSRLFRLRLRLCRTDELGYWELGYLLVLLYDKMDRLVRLRLQLRLSQTDKLGYWELGYLLVLLYNEKDTLVRLWLQLRLCQTDLLYDEMSRLVRLWLRLCRTDELGYWELGYLWTFCSSFLPEMVRLQLCHPNTNTIMNKPILRLVESDPTSNMNTNVFPVKHNTSTNTNHFVNKPPKPLMEVMKLMENDLCSITHPNRSLMSLKLMEK